MSSSTSQPSSVSPGRRKTEASTTAAPISRPADERAQPSVLAPFASAGVPARVRSTRASATVTRAAIGAASTDTVAGAPVSEMRFTVSASTAGATRSAPANRSQRRSLPRLKVQSSVAARISAAARMPAMGTPSGIVARSATPRPSTMRPVGSTTPSRVGASRVQNAARRSTAVNPPIRPWARSSWSKPVTSATARATSSQSTAVVRGAARVSDSGAATAPTRVSTIAPDSSSPRPTAWESRCSSRRARNTASTADSVPSHQLVLPAQLTA